MRVSGDANFNASYGANTNMQAAAQPVITSSGLAGNTTRYTPNSATVSNYTNADNMADSNVPFMAKYRSKWHVRVR